MLLRDWQMSSSSSFDDVSRDRFIMSAVWTENLTCFDSTGRDGVFPPSARY